MGRTGLHIVVRLGTYKCDPHKMQTVQLFKKSMAVFGEIN